MRSLTSAVLVLAILPWPGAALAAEPPPVSAVAQYVETIPTSDGGTAAGSPADEQASPSVPLTPTSREALKQRGGNDAKPLEALATRPEYGAPRPITEAPTTQSVDFAPVSASLSAAAGSAGNSLLPLFIGMALIALATVVAAARARR
jgi:hypothetical protein